MVALVVEAAPPKESTRRQGMRFYTRSFAIFLFILFLFVFLVVLYFYINIRIPSPRPMGIGLQWTQSWPGLFGHIPNNFCHNISTRMTADGVGTERVWNLGHMNGARWPQLLAWPKRLVSHNGRRLLQHL